MTICVFMRHMNLAAPHVIMASFMRHRQLLLFTLVRCVFHCTLSAPVTREIDSSAIGRYRDERGEPGREGQNNTQKVRGRGRRKEEEETGGRPSVNPWKIQFIVMPLSFLWHQLVMKGAEETAFIIDRVASARLWRVDHTP